MQRPSTWVLTYSRLGDNNQALALARSLGRPFETKKLRYNWLRHFGLHFGPSFITLDRASRDSLQAPWPELVISIGRFSVPVARAIKARSGGRTKTIFLGNPRVDPRHFDLVFATRDYLRPRGPNVVVLPLPMGLPVEKHAEAGWAMGLPHPRTLLLIGASIKYWELTPASIASTVEVLADRANKARGSLLVSGSPRTPDAVLLAAENALARANDGWMSPSRKGGLAAMLDAADEVVVTGDSMSMVTDAVLTGKPVGIVPLELSERGRNKLGPSAAAEGSRSKRRDMRRFWADLWAKGLAGTAAQPKAATIASSAAAAALLVASYMNVAQSPEMVDEPIPAAAPAPSMLRAILSFASLAGTLVDRAQQDAGALWLATWEPETPWYVKLIAGTTSISALSPVDLTPDVIPVIGYMDDLLLLTIGMLLTARLIPKPLMAQLRERAVSVDFTNARRGALAVCGLWLASAAAAVLRASGLF